MADRPPFDACIVIPTFDHGASVAAVVAAAAARLPVVVVDDGSRDDTGASLAGAPATVLRHARNRGKGAALRTGMLHAAAQGFTHAIVLDADGWHEPDDVAVLGEAAAAEPDALVAGVRALHAGNSTRLRRVDRRIAGFWLGLASGRRLPDVTHGLRCYPLASVLGLAARGARYEWEQDVLALWCWSGRPLRWIPIGTRRVAPGVPATHVRPLRDFLLLSVCYWRRIAARSVLPAAALAERAGVAWAAQPRHVRALRTAHELLVRPFARPAAAALAVLLGVAGGLVPALPAVAAVPAMAMLSPLRPVLVLLLASLLRLPKMPALLAATLTALSWKTLPPS